MLKLNLKYKILHIKKCTTRSCERWVRCCLSPSFRGFGTADHGDENRCFHYESKNNFYDIFHLKLTTELKSPPKYKFINPSNCKLHKCLHFYQCQLKSMGNQNKICLGYHPFDIVIESLNLKEKLWKNY